MYEHAHLAVPLFLAFFGVMFVIFGIRRMLEARTGKDATGSVFWGAVGALIGFAFFYGAYYFVKPS